MLSNMFKEEFEVRLGRKNIIKIYVCHIEELELYSINKFPKM